MADKCIAELGTFGEVSRNLDFSVIQRIMASKELPAEWAGHAKLELAHRLYWEENPPGDSAETLVVLRTQRGDLYA